MGRWVAVALCLCPLALLSARAARADVEVQDGTLFSFKIAAPTRFCVQFPSSRFDPGVCGSLKPTAQEPVIPEGRAIAMGRVFFDDHGARADAVLAAQFSELSAVTSTADYVPSEFASGMAKTMASSIGVDADHVHVVSSRVVVVAGVAFIRAVIDSTGLPPEKRTFEHAITYSGASDRGLYALMLASTAEHKEALDALVDANAASLRIANPAPSNDRAHSSDAYRSGYLLGQVVVYVALAAVVATIVVRARRRRAKA
jgi:hypothetical protein